MNFWVRQLTFNYFQGDNWTVTRPSSHYAYLNPLAPSPFQASTTLSLSTSSFTFPGIHHPLSLNFDMATNNHPLSLIFDMATNNSIAFAFPSSGQHLILQNLFPRALLLFSLLLFFPLRSLVLAKPKKNENPLPPGPAPWPIIGSLLAISRNKPAFRGRWILNIMKEMDTDIACIRLGNTHVIPVTCPKIARDFLKNHDAIFASRPVAMASEYISRGYLSIITSPWGDQWKKMRRVVSSELFSASKLRCLLHKRTGEADNLVRYIHAQCKSRNGDEKGAVVNVREAAQHYCGNVIRKLVFNVRYFGAGREDGGPGLEEEEHVQALFKILSLLYSFDVADYLPKLRWLDLEGDEKMMRRAFEVVDKYHDPIIESRIMRWRSGALRDPEDMLDLMILAKDGDGNPSLSIEEIKAQITVNIEKIWVNFKYTH